MAIKAGKTFQKMMVTPADRKVWEVRTPSTMGKYVHYRLHVFAPRKTGVVCTVSLKHKVTGEELVAVSVDYYNQWVPANLIAVV